MPGFSAEYFVATNGVDTNPGTSNAPFATINKGASVAQAGDMVWIKPGLYQPTTMIQPVNSGTSNEPITYRAQTGGQVIIDGRTTVPISSGRKGLFYITGKSWIVVDGLRVINSGFSGIFMENSTNVTVQNCSTYFTYASGIIAAGGANIKVFSNSVQRACVMPSPGTGVNECITMASVNTFEVAYNTVFDRPVDTANGGEGIDAKNSCLNGTIHHNLVYDLVRMGIYVDAYSKNLTNVQVYANTVRNCSAGITVASEVGAVVDTVKVHDNLVYDCRNGVGIRLAGYLGNGPLLNVDVFQNTVVRCGKTNIASWENCGLLVEADNPTNSNLNVRNNIFSQNTAQIRHKNQSYLTLDRNLVDGYSIGNGGGNPYGSNVITNSPSFVNAAANDFRLATNSPAIDAALGAPLSTRDGDDLTRPIAGPGNVVAVSDLGAFEWSPLLPSANAPLILPSHVGVSNQLVFRVATHPAYDYVLLGATNLKSPVLWSALVTNSGTGSFITNTIPVSATPQQFFRYRVQ